RLYCETTDKVNDNSSRFRVFYTYCKNVLLTICNDMDKLLDYIVYAMYMDKNYKTHNDDKSILWNCFGEEIMQRVSSGKNYKKFDDSNLMKKWRKAEVKLDNIKTDDKKVNVVVAAVKVIKVEKGETKIKEKTKLDEKTKPKDEIIKIDVNAVDINFTKGDIDFIKQQERCVRQLVFVLLALYKMFKTNECNFTIVNGRKNKITPSHIIRLSSIDGRNYETLMEELFADKIITSNKGAVELLIKFTNESSFGEPIFKINNINDCEKYFRKYVK
ncbi:MAG: hypothetical protein ACYDG2_23735, partial [Ruminiclostridium sp.]